VDEAHAYQVLCYVELNPVRAGMAKHASDYAWSSAPLHCDAAALDGSRADPGDAILDLTAWRVQMPPRQWRATLKEVARDKAALERIRRNTYIGRPLGAGSVLSKTAPLIGRQKGWCKKKVEENNATRENKHCPRLRAGMETT